MLRSLVGSEMCIRDRSLLLLMYFANCCIIIIFYPRPSLFSAHTHTTHNTIPMFHAHQLHVPGLKHFGRTYKNCYLDRTGLPDYVADHQCTWLKYIVSVVQVSVQVPVPILQVRLPSRPYCVDYRHWVTKHKVKVVFVATF